LSASSVVVRLDADSHRPVRRSSGRWAARGEGRLGVADLSFIGGWRWQGWSSRTV